MGEYAVTVRREIAAPSDELLDAWLDGQSLGSCRRGGRLRSVIPLLS